LPLQGVLVQAVEPAQFQIANVVNEGLDDHNALSSTALSAASACRVQ
jgi:hypothetical protein